MIGPLFDMFTGAMFIFPFMRFLNIFKPRRGWSILIGILRKWVASLPIWLRMMNADWLDSIRPEIFLQMKFVIFQECPIKQAVFLPE